MPIQTTYSERIDKARAGLVSGSKSVKQTGLCETAAGIGFGLAVSQGAGDQGVILGGTLAGFRGISVRDVTLGAGVDVYPQTSNVGVLTDGQIWVVPAAAVAAGDPVHFDAATGALSNAGGQGPIKGARWVDSGSDFARVEVSGYNQD